MRIAENHILEYLDDFIGPTDVFFESVFKEIRDPDKNRFEKLLRYLSRIIQMAKNQNNNEELGLLHLHFQDDFDDDFKTLISHFLIIYQFKAFISKELPSTLVNESIISLKKSLRNEKRKLLSCPDGASGINGGNRVFKDWSSQKLKITELLRFYDTLDETISLSPATLFNCQVCLQKNLLSLLQTSPFALKPDANALDAYVILNSDSMSSLREIKVGDQILLRMIEDVFLFDCENRVKKFSDFNAERLTNLNKSSSTRFKNLILMTFGDEATSINEIRSKIDLIKGRFKIKDNSAYSILSSEVAHLTNQGSQAQIQVAFHGEQNSDLWDSFLLETSEKDLYELRSIRLMNIYSLAFNEKIKDYILNEIFSSQSSKLITPETKLAIKELDELDIKALNDSLSNVLELIIHENMKGEIIEFLNQGSEIIVPDLLFKDRYLKTEIFNALGLTKEQKLKSWTDIDIKTKMPILILAYRDPGKFQYHFDRNVLETKFNSSKDVKAVFISFFYKVRFEWANYNLDKDIQRYLFHSVRAQFFKWNELRRKIVMSKPQILDTVNWNLENEIESEYSENRETVRVKFTNPSKTKTFLPSDLFIAKFNGIKGYRVERLGELCKLNLKEDKLAIQSLDEIQESINIYEKIIDKNQQENELKIIQSQFNIQDSNPEKLWKVLLRKQADSKGEENFYFEQKAFLEIKNLGIVSFSHFKNNWINPNSDSLTPISNKVFLALCDFLKIPRAYYIKMQRIKNASKQASRQSTRQMNYLLKDLFNDECFDDLTKTKDILKVKAHQYKENHPMDEIGIEAIAMEENLVTLVELIHSEISLNDVESLEIIKP